MRLEADDYLCLVALVRKNPQLSIRNDTDASTLLAFVYFSLYRTIFTYGIIRDRASYLQGTC